MKILRLLLCISIVAANEIFALTSNRIVAGRDCNSQEYPYHASLASGTNHLCGGSFITPGWVLTAAHCLESMNKTWPFAVVAGQSRLLFDEQEYSPVEAVYLHKQFRLNPASADVGLIKLNKPVTPSARVKISKLATTADYEELIKSGTCNNSLIMGFGMQMQYNYADIQSILNKTTQDHIDDHIKCANLSVLPRSECQEKMPGHVSDDAFCMQHPVHKDMDACKGDSGGPVYCGNLQIGIVSAGLGCGDEKYPGFYTRVDQFTHFIERHLHMEEGKSSTGHFKGTLMILVAIINIVTIFNTYLYTY